jgi:hypothetical protein
LIEISDTRTSVSNDVKLPVAYGNREKVFVIQLDAAASMLMLRFRGLLLIKV